MSLDTMGTLQISSNGISPYIVIPVALLFAAFTWYYYHTTTPPVAPWLRRTLRTVRLLAILLTVMLLMRPVFTRISQKTVLPVVAVLADDSRSMRITDNGSARTETLKRVLHRMSAWDVFKKNAALKLYRFAAGADTFAVAGIDSLRFEGNATNIGDNAAALVRNRIKDNIRAIVLVTDGAVNSGMFPETAVKGSGIPVHAVGIGDSTPVRDLAVSNVLNNDVAYRNNAVPVKISMTANGYAGRNVTVMIKEEGAVLARTTVRLGPDRQEQEVTLELKPETEGMHRYTVVLPVLKGEKISRNNRTAFSVRVLKDKLKVLMISGYPGFDTHFMKMALDNDPAVMPDLRYALPGGTFSGGPVPATDAAMDAYDLIVLQDVPASRLPRKTTDAIIRAVRQKGKGLLVLAGEQSCIDEDFSVSPLQAILPVTYANDVPRAVVRDFQPFLTPDGERHQVTALTDDPAENTGLWRNIPPFAALVKPQSVAAGAEVLATHPSQKYAGGAYAPVFALARAGAGRVLQVCAFPLWRWRFSLLPVDPAAAETYNLFMGNTIRWLLSSDENKLFSVKPARRIYRAGQTVVLEAQLYDSQYKPRDGAAVEAVLANRGFERRITLEPSGEPGLYRAGVTGVPAGTFRLTAAASIKGRRIAADTSKAYVDDHSLEFDDIRMRADILRSTAFATGGTFLTAENIAQLEDKLAFTPEQVAVKKHWEPWNSWWLMAVIIALLCAEWVVRKRKGML